MRVLGCSAAFLWLYVGCVLGCSGAELVVDSRLLYAVCVLYSGLFWGCTCGRLNAVLGLCLYFTLGLILVYY